MPLITLTTDFGVDDGYVAILKGVIHRHAPDAKVVDITHTIPRHDIAFAAFALANAIGWFPPDAIHVAVVDPGVGTSRPGLALRLPHGTVVAPDNGLVSTVLARLPGGDTLFSHDATYLTPLEAAVPSAAEAWHLDTERIADANLSTTFHARDLFAPTAARLAAGCSLTELADRTDRIALLNTPPVREIDGETHGHVVHSDTYGNLITDLPNALFERPFKQVRIGDHAVLRLSATYADMDGLGAVLGSHGHLELAVNRGSARDLTAARRGDGVVVSR